MFNVVEPGDGNLSGNLESGSSLYENFQEYISTNLSDQDLSQNESMEHLPQLEIVADGSTSSSNSSQTNAPNQLSDELFGRNAQVQNEDKDSSASQKSASVFSDNPAPITLSQLNEVGTNLFDKLDQDKNGYMTKQELADGVAFEHLTGQEAQTTAALYKTADDMQNLSDDEWGSEDDGITLADLNQFDKTQAKMGLLDIGGHEQFSDAKFSTFDRDNDGFLSEEELESGIEDKSTNQFDRRMLQHISDNVETMQTLSNDEWGYENDGVTTSDLEKFSEMFGRNSIEKAQNMVYKSVIQNRFSNFDQDGNGFLSKEEIAIEKHKNPVDSRFFSQLNKNFDEVQEASDDEWGFENDGISEDDLDAYFEYWQEFGKQPDVKTYASWMIRRTSEAQKPEMSRELFANTDDPLSSITPDAIDQGTIGDCYFLAALGAVAEQKPELIKNMINDQGAFYEVTFPGAQDNIQLVLPPTDAEFGLYNNASEHGTWATLLEKAYGSYKQEVKGKGGLTPTEGADGGGQTETVLELLTGEEFEGLKINEDTDISQLSKMFDEAFLSGKEMPVTAAVFGGRSGRSPDGFPGPHAYTVTDFQYNDEGKGVVTVYNPHGGADNTISGTMELDMDKFIKNFEHITIARS